MGRVCTDEELAEAYKSGSNMYKVSEDYRVSYSTVRRAIISQGVEVRRPGQRYPLPDRVEFEKDCQRLRWYELSEKYKVTWSMIKYWKERFGLTTGKKENRVIFHTERADGCWVCKSHGYSKGYPRTKRGLVAKVLWVEKNGDFPENALLRHLCGRKWCVNPSHVCPGSQFENVVDAVLDGDHARGVLRRAVSDGIVIDMGDCLKRSVDGKIFRKSDIFYSSVNEGGEITTKE